MWRTFWRSIDRFSLQHFKYVVNELQMIKVVDKQNRELVIDLFQSIVEIVTYGDRHDPSIFECFMEYQVLAEFVRVLKISRNARIEAPLLQYLSIMIQNMEGEHAIYYCLSNDYINSIITHQFELDGGDLAPYYVSFLRAVSGKITRGTLCLLVKVHEDVVVSFPLYTEALKFAHHGEKMIQIAVRAITLNIFNVSDDMVYQFMTTPPVSEYFSGLVLNLRTQCFHLDAVVHATENTYKGRREELLLETDKIVDDLYYFKDIYSVGELHLSKTLTRDLVSMLVFPILLPLVHLSQSSGTQLSAITSLFVVSRLLQVLEGTNMANFVASAILCFHMSSSIEDVNNLHNLEEMVCPEPEGDENFKRSNIPGHLSDFLASSSHILSFLPDDINKESRGCERGDGNIGLVGEETNSLTVHQAKRPDQQLSKPMYDGSLKRNFSHENGEDDGVLLTYQDVQLLCRGGIIQFILSEDHGLMLASLMLLLVLAESKDLNYQLAAMMGFSQSKSRMPKTHGFSASPEDGSTIVTYMHQILNALLMVLASEPPCSALIQWHSGWILRKLLVFQEKRLHDFDFQLFHKSYEQSCKRLREELHNCWFDYIPDTLRNEWASCKSALQESSQSKDPFFALDLACHHNNLPCDSTPSALAWHRMVEAVKVLVLHLQLKPFIFGGDPFDNPLISLKSSSLAISGRKYASDLSSASFGSDIALGSGIPCQIAFSKGGIRDIYIIAIARETSGKLLLLEKHPLHSKRGVVIAIAPLAGLSPKIDENHPSWLHLQIRDFDPKFEASKIKGHHSSMSIHEADRRWTLGFSNVETCEAARSMIFEETSKQRSAVESLLATLLQDNFPGNSSDSQGL
ncbi:unnamed protein product [Ilex paraguariensis]|uniref:FPL domain-containing protein n=1 Tax=Ilex paraguariensis TaxID=185542 RepID=A0ABC8UHS4_9AQUA